jgi:hypothetical protein
VRCFCFDEMLMMACLQLCSSNSIDSLPQGASMKGYNALLNVVPLHWAFEVLCILALHAIIAACCMDLLYIYAGHSCSSGACDYSSLQCIP